MLAGDEVLHHSGDVARQARVIESGRKLLGATTVAHIHADNVASGAPELVGIADDVLGVRRALETVDDDGRGTCGAHFRWLPMAMTENLARYLIAGRGGDFDQLGHGRGELVGARQEVADDGLEVTVREEAAGLKGEGVEDDAGESGGCHSRFPAAASNATALRAPVGSSSCLR